jgi:hypothetical protein
MRSPLRNHFQKLFTDKKASIGKYKDAFSYYFPEFKSDLNIFTAAAVPERQKKKSDFLL